MRECASNSYCIHSLHSGREHCHFEFDCIPLTISRSTNFLPSALYFTILPHVFHSSIPVDEDFRYLLCCFSVLPVVSSMPAIFLQWQYAWPELTQKALQHTVGYYPSSCTSCIIKYNYVGGVNLKRPRTDHFLYTSLY